MKEGVYSKPQGKPMQKPKNKVMVSYMMGDNPNKELPAKSLTPKPKKGKKR